MVSRSRRGRIKWSNVLKKIKFESKVHEGWEVIGRRATATIECEGFKSLVVLWTKVYEWI